MHENKLNCVSRKLTALENKTTRITWNNQKTMQTKFIIRVQAKRTIDYLSPEGQNYGQIRMHADDGHVQERDVFVFCFIKSG